MKIHKPLFSFYDFQKLATQNKEIERKKFLYEQRGFEYFWQNISPELREIVVLHLIDRIND